MLPVKNLEQFEKEETGEEWLRELYKVIAQRRNAMFRLITESVRMLLLGNVGGAGLVIGFLTAMGGADSSAFHWAGTIILFVFSVGVLSSALTMILVTAVSIREAHGAEEGLKKFLDGVIDRSGVLFNVDARVFRVADLATFSGTVSAIAFMLGGVGAIVLMMIFF